MRFDLKPTAVGEAIFLVFIAVMIVLCFHNLTAVYSHGVVWTVGGALCISWLSMQLWAAVFEHRMLQPPSSQYFGFYWGDLVALPVLAAMFCLMRQHYAGDTLADRLWWRLLCLGAGLIAGLGFHFVEAAGTFYSTSQLHSPTKLWHDLFALPVFVYFLGSQVPLLWHGTRTMVIVAVAAFALWAGLTFVYDLNHPKTQAHVNFDWRDLKPLPAATAR